MPPARHDLRRAAQSDSATHRVRRRSRHAGEVRQGHQGAGRLYGRHALHDVERHLRRQRHRARHRLADASLAGRVLRSRQGQDSFLGQAAVRRPHHSLSRLLARHRIRRQGHRLCAHRPSPQNSGDVASVRARPRRRNDSVDLLQDDPLHAGRRELAYAFRRRAHQGREGGRRHDRRRHRRGHSRSRQEACRARRASARRKWREGDPRRARGSLRPISRAGSLRSRHRRNLRRSRRRDHRQDAAVSDRKRLRRTAGARHRSHQCRPLHPQYARGRQEFEPRGCAVRHLSRHASGRAADDRHGGSHVPFAVLRSGALRSLGGRPRQDEHAPRSRRAGHDAHVASRGHHRGGEGARRSARRPRRDRRHRPSRQSTRAFGRRTDGKSVSAGPAAHGARHQGAHVLGRYRHGHAAGPHQRQAGGGGGARVLRLVAVVAVHGSDQSAVGDHP